jgi:2-oxoglutarate dehydrogenase E2 component (dihydrolipoamide succinyltransferase)
VSQPVAVTAPNPPVATMAYITPLVRKLAGQLGVDLTQVVGSGVGGRIRREDVEQEAARLEAERQAAEAARLEAERQAAEAARLEAERQAAEVARLEAERQAAEAARLEAERQAAEAARLAAHAPQPASTPTAAPAPSATPAAATPAAPTPGALALAAAGTSAFAAALPPAPTHPALTAYPTQPAQGATSAPATGPAEPDARRGTSEPLTWQRSAMAERMVSSLHATAQVTATAEVDVTRVAALIDAAAPAVLAREGIQLGFLPFFTVAAIEALQANPTLNATLEGDQIRYHAVENIAFTVDTPLGPVTPVVKNAGSLTLIDLARTVADLAARIHDNAIMPDELAGGTFTVTNPGSGDALFETPIVHEPQVAILSFGAIVKRPVVVTDPAAGDAIAVRSMAYLALSYDHRLVDGPDAGRFLAMVRHRIESGAFDIDLPTT